MNAQFHGNRRKPDKLHWVLTILMSLATSGIAYQIVDNQENAVNRAQVQSLLDHDKNRIEQWQIDEINRQLDGLKKQINDVTIYKPIPKNKVRNRKESKRK